MKWKTKWFLSIIFVLGIIGIAKLEEKQVIEKPFTQYVTTGQDFLVMKKWVASYFDKPEDELLTVSYAERALGLYESIQPFQNGAIISYGQPIAVEAEKSGLVIFTGITRQTGKTITVLYDDGDEVTYGFVGSFSKLPYTTVKMGDQLALMDEETMFLMVKRDGVHLDASLLPAYLSGSVE